MKSVHQILPNLAYGDAISQHALVIQKLAHQKGFQSEIFVQHLDRRVSHLAKPLTQFPENSAWTLYHHSIGCKPAVAQFLKAQGKRSLIYHNITPSHFFNTIDSSIVALLDEGRRQLEDLKPHVESAFGDSEFNCEELRALGFPSVTCLPILLDFERWNCIPSDQGVLQNLDYHFESQAKSQDAVYFLFVGRVAPNKCHEDLILCFEQYYRMINPKARLLLVGTIAYGHYHHRLLNLCRSRGIAQNVSFFDQVTESKLKSFYQGAHLFLSMSEHEGFCVPLIEAMHFELPILAYDSSAIAWTLGQGGVLLKKKNFRQAALLADTLTQDASFKARILKGQKLRLSEFQADALIPRYKQCLFSN